MINNNQSHICCQNIVASVLANRVVYGSLSYLVFGLNPRVYRHTTEGTCKGYVVLLSMFSAVSLRRTQTDQY